MKVSVVQSSARAFYVAGNLKSLDEKLAQLKEQGVELALLPEFFPMGNPLEPAMLRYAMESSAQVEEWLKNRAARLNMILAGAYLRHESQDIYNVFAFCEPNGNMALHYKMHAPAPEAAYYRVAEKNDHILETGIGKVGAIICAESFSPESLLADYTSCALIMIVFAIPNALCVYPPLKHRFTHIPAALAKRNGVGVLLCSMGGSFVTKRSFSAPFARNGMYAGRSGIFLPSSCAAGPVPPGQEGFLTLDLPLGPGVAVPDPQTRIKAGMPFFMRVYDALFMKIAQKIYQKNMLALKS